MNKTLYVLLFAIVVITSCKKEKAATTVTTNPEVPTTGSTLDKIRDSIYLYAKEDYYWYDALPSYTTFNPRSFTGTTDLDALQSEVDKLSQYKINPDTQLPYEYVAGSNGEAKYSFIDDGTESAKLNGVTGDFGLAPFFASRTTLYVKYVYPGSPADLAGIKRGYRILATNGTTSFDSNSQSNLDLIYDAYFNSSTIKLTLQKPDASTMNVTLNSASYTVNPVFLSKVIDQGNGSKVGYLVFKDFVSLASSKTQLDNIFSTFKYSGVTDLIIDLRYNGGGYVETAEYLDNLIAPASTNNQVMYNTYYNDILTSGKAVLLKNQVRKDDNGKSYNLAQVDFSVAGNQTKFGTSHPLNLNRVFFIVTGSTASASELTINNLRPYMTVKLVGSTTYGKPVGFFDIDINKYQMYIPEFETKNSAGQGGYFSGMTPGTANYAGYAIRDDVTKEFGDPNEGLLAATLNYIKSGSYTSAVATQSVNAVNAMTLDEQAALSAKMDKDKFKGMLYKFKKHQ